MSVLFLDLEPHTPPRPNRPAQPTQTVSPRTPPPISTLPLPAYSYSSPLKRRKVTQNVGAISSKIQRVSDDMLKPESSPLQNRYGKAPHLKYKTPPPTPRIANKCKTNLGGESVETLQRRARFKQARDTCDRVTRKLTRIGIGRFHNTYAVGAGEVLKTPNELEFRDSEGKGLIFERIEFAQRNYLMLLEAKANGLLPDLHIVKTEFDCEHAIIRQIRCPHLLTKEDLLQPAVVAKVAKLFASAYQHNIPIDLKRDNLGWLDEEKTKLAIFDHLEASVGSFRVRTQSLLEETAEGDEELFLALDPRPPGSLH